jgi:hypothetical protein
MSIQTRIYITGAFVGLLCLPTSVINSMPTENMTATNGMVVPSSNPMATPTPEVVPTQPATQQPAVQASTPANIQTQTANQQPTTTTAITPNINDYKKELDQINTQLETIKQHESTLKTVLTQLDDRLEKAKGIALTARKKSMDILSQPAQAEAQKILDEINQSFQEISKIQQESQTDATTNFQSTADKIQTAIADVKNTISQLQAKGISLKLAQDQAQQTTSTNIGDKKQAFRSWFIAEPNGQEPGVEKTFIHYLFNRAADLVSGAFRVIAASYHVIKDAITGTPQKPASPTQQVTPSAQPAAQPNQSAIPTQAQQPNMPLAAAGKPPAAALTATTESLKPFLDNQEQIVAELYKTRQDCASKLKEISWNINGIILTLASNPDIKSSIRLVDLTYVHPTEEPSWKKSVVQGFSFLLDGLIYIYNTVSFSIKYVYKRYISPLFSQFKADVQKKLQEQEATKTQTQPQQTKPSPQEVPAQMPVA